MVTHIQQDKTYEGVSQPCNHSEQPKVCRFVEDASPPCAKILRRQIKPGLAQFSSQDQCLPSLLSKYLITILLSIYLYPDLISQSK